MLLENIKAQGEVHLLLTAGDGSVIEDQTHNLVVTVGLAHIISRLKDATASVMSHMAVGTTNTAAATAQTALVAEAARVALTSTTQVTTTLTGDTLQFVATFPAGTGTGAIVEAGLFNASSAGVMLARTVFGVLTKGAADSLTITWKIKVA